MHIQLSFAWNTDKQIWFKQMTQFIITSQKEGGIEKNPI